MKSGGTIPVTRTQSTIPADLVQNVMRLPYRERFTILINELGAAVAARSEDLQTALRRADPALAETDNLLKLLADDAQAYAELTTLPTDVAKDASELHPRWVEDARSLLDKYVDQGELLGCANAPVDYVRECATLDHRRENTGVQQGSDQEIRHPTERAPSTPAAMNRIRP